jgi:hypothetical protein
LETLTLEPNLYTCNFKSIKNVLLFVFVLTLVFTTAQKNAKTLDQVNKYLADNNTFFAIKETEKISPDSITTARYWITYSMIHVKNHMATKAFACLNPALVIEPKNCSIYLEKALSIMDLYFDPTRVMVSINKAVEIE